MKHKWGKTLQNRSFRGPHIHKRWRKKAQTSDLRLFMKVKEEDSIIPPQLLLILWKKAPPQVSTIDLSATKCGHTSSRCIQSSKLIDIFGAFDYIWSLLPTHHGNATSHHNVYVYRYIDIYVFRFINQNLCSLRNGVVDLSSRSRDSLRSEVAAEVAIVWSRILKGERLGRAGTLSMSKTTHIQIWFPPRSFCRLYWYL